MKTPCLFLLVLLFLTSCTSLNSVSLTPIPEKRENPIKVERSRFIVFGLNFDNDYVDGMAQELARKCTGGKVQGILTKDELVNYFLYLFVSRKVTATGYCVKG